MDYHAQESWMKVVAEIQALVALLESLRTCEHGETDDMYSRIKERVEIISTSLQAANKKVARPSTITSKIHHITTSIWNITVELNAKGMLDKNINALVRQEALTLAVEVLGSNQDHHSRIKLIQMATKTGHAWLATKLRESANSAFQVALQVLEKLSITPSSLGSSSPFTLCIFRLYVGIVEVAWLQRDYNSAFAYVSRAKGLLEPLPEKAQELAMICYQHGSNIFFNNPEAIVGDTNYYEKAIAMLRESYSILSKVIDSTTVSMIHQRQARTLRLLAMVYISMGEEKHLRMGLNAADMAISEEGGQDARTMFLRTKALLLLHNNNSMNVSNDNESCQQDDNNDESSKNVKMVFHQTLHLADITADIALMLVDECYKLGSEFSVALALDGLSSMECHFQQNHDNDSLIRIRLRAISIHLSMPNSDNNSKLTTLLEDTIAGHKSSRIPLTTEQEHVLHECLWKAAAESFKLQQYTKANCWYQYSLRCTSPDDFKALSGNHRNRALCYLECEDLDNAAQSVAEAESLELQLGKGVDPKTSYLLFRIALCQNNERVATSALQAMCDINNRNDFIDGEAVRVIKDDSINDHLSCKALLCVAAEQAFQHNSRRNTILALEGLVPYLDDKRILIVLRCLIRLKLSKMNGEDDCNEQENDDRSKIPSTIRFYLSSALDHLKKLAKTTSDGKSYSNTDYIESEVTWFQRIAWNMGVRSSRIDEVMNTYYFFYLSYSFSTISNSVTTENINKVSESCKKKEDESHRVFLAGQQKSLIMAISAGIGTAKALQTDNTIRSGSTSADVLVEVTACISKCRTITEQLHNSEQEACDYNDMTEHPHFEILPTSEVVTYMALHEFQCRILLAADTSELLQLVQTVSHEVKCLEAMASIALNEDSNKHREVAYMALTLAIRERLASASAANEINETLAVRLSIDVRSLIEIANDDKDTWNLYVKLKAALQDDKLKELFPCMEITWLMVNAWNHGVQLLYGQRNEENGMRWLDMAFSYLDLLPVEIRDSYRGPLSERYTQVLDAADNLKNTTHGQGDIFDRLVADITTKRSDSNLVIQQ